MKLSEEQKKKLAERLNSFPPPQKCSVCGQNTWSLNDTVFEYREFQGGGFVLGPNQSVYPAVFITCNNCGNTHVLNAIRIGVLEPQKVEEHK
jgi:hypothetical protein